jgi:hypothetical protein
MDPKIPAHLKAYMKKGKATRPKEKKVLHPSYKQKQSNKQSQVVIINSSEPKKRKAAPRKSNPNTLSRISLVGGVNPHKKGTDGDYPRVAYIPYSIPQMSLPAPAYQQPQAQPQAQQAPPQFRDNRAYDNRAFAQYFQYNMPMPQEMGAGEIPMENMFQRQPAPYSLINPQGVIPLNPLPIEDYQVEQNLPNIPIPVANPVLPDIPLEPVRVEKVSGQRDRRFVIQDESESNGNVSDIQLEMFPSPPPPVFTPLKPINELVREKPENDNTLQGLINLRKQFLISGYDPEDSDSSVYVPPIRNRERYQPETPTEQMPIIRDRRRENTGRPREPLSQEETQLISSFIEITNTIPSKNRTPEQTDIVKRGRTLYNSKKRNHKEEVEQIKTRIEELVTKEGRQYRKKK